MKLKKKKTFTLDGVYRAVINWPDFWHDYPNVDRDRVAEMDRYRSEDSGAGKRNITDKGHSSVWPLYHTYGQEAH